MKPSPSRSAFGFVAALLLLAPSPALACTALLKPVEQVVREAEVILRVQALGATAETAPGHVAFRVLEVVAGRSDAAFLAAAGALGDHAPAPRRPVPYRELDCGRAAGCGGCYATRYREGRQYLLLLKGGTPYWAPLAPTGEEISGPGDPWLAWVRARR